MRELPFTLINGEGHPIYVYHWAPDENDVPRGIVQISHGMAETAERYKRFAQELCSQGYHVYGNDHRGHGRTASSVEQLGYTGPDGLNGMVRDLRLLRDEIRRRHDSVPLFLLGHSMGSFLVQKIMYTSPGPYAGFLLTGTCGKQPMLTFGQLIASVQCRLQSDKHPSMLLSSLVFGRYNRNFLPTRTGVDWLTRDEAEVDKYLNDPCCGALCCAGFYDDFFRLLREIHRKENMSQIPKDKPVFVFCGEADPVGLNGKGVRRLITVYQELGILDLQWKLYPGARHELLNETNRDEVTEDVLHWLNEHN